MHLKGKLSEDRKRSTPDNLSVESQKSAINIQRCSIENQNLWALSLYKVYGIMPFWFSMEHIWIVIVPFWLSTDELLYTVRHNFCGFGLGSEIRQGLILRFSDVFITITLNWSGHCCEVWLTKFANIKPPCKSTTYTVHWIALNRAHPNKQKFLHIHALEVEHFIVVVVANINIQCKSNFKLEK